MTRHPQTRSASEVHPLHARSQHLSVYVCTHGTSPERLEGIAQIGQCIEILAKSDIYNRGFP
jgi:hypothetical protein